MILGYNICKKVKSKSCITFILETASSACIILVVLVGCPSQTSWVEPRYLALNNTPSIKTERWMTSRKVNEINYFKECRAIKKLDLFFIIILRLTEMALSWNTFTDVYSLVDFDFLLIFFIMTNKYFKFSRQQCGETRDVS